MQALRRNMCQFFCLRGGNVQDVDQHEGAPPPLPDDNEERAAYMIDEDYEEPDLQEEEEGEERDENPQQYPYEASKFRDENEMESTFYDAFRYFNNVYNMIEEDPKPEEDEKTRWKVYDDALQTSKFDWEAKLPVMAV